ncbi:glycoprotein precursor [Pangolin orthonairovirus]|uniref:M polyprotein n=1 Tax=Pangolin orthonairovirus TaxID=2951875 RepID=A0AAE9LFW4_9VIRU|nr:glycoprotein precursor [Pangolin orthonairovirus]
MSPFHSSHHPSKAKWYSVFFLLLILFSKAQVKGESQANSSASSNSTTVHPTSSASSPTTSPQEEKNHTQNATEQTTLNNVSALSIQRKEPVLQFITSSISQLKSWGTNSMSIITSVGEGIKKNTQMVQLLFNTGRQYEKLVSQTQKFNLTSILRTLGKKLSIEVTNGMKVLTDGLGGVGGGAAMRVTGSFYFIQERTGGVSPWSEESRLTPEPTCGGSKVVRNQHYQSYNIEVQYDPQEPLVVIAYATSYLGIEVSSCWATVEHHGNLATLTDESNLIRDWFSNGTEIYPIMHITINRLELSKVCRITLCSVRDTSNIGKEVFKQGIIDKVVFEFTPPKGTNGIHRKLLSLDKGLVKEPCSSGTKVITAVKFETHTTNNSSPGPYKTFCNGTKVVNGYAPPELGCFSITRKLAKVQCPTKKELVTKEHGDCSFQRSHQNCKSGFFCITVQTPGRGIVKVASEEERAHEDCNKECSFILRGYEATITCPNGMKHSVVSSELKTNCFLSDYGHLPLWACRMSFRPSVVYLLIVWYFFGYLVWRCLLLIVQLLLRITAVAIRLSKLRADQTRGTCEMCNIWVPSRFHWQRHENCRNGRCPYCRLSCSNEKLKLHAKECVQKRGALQEDEEAVTVSYIPLALRATTVAIASMNKTISKSLWVITTVILFYVCIHPVYALSDTSPEEDLWNKEVDFVEHCNIGCIQGEDDCACPLEAQEHIILRKPLSLFPKLAEMAKLGSRRDQTKPLLSIKKRVIDVTAPWGILHVNDAFSPSYSGKHISLSWTETSASGDHITINGKSEAVMKLEAGTGLMWEIGSPSSTETRRVFVSILDHTQVYTSRFLYATGDRVVEPWMHGRCTGECPDKCSCNNHLCHHSEFDDFTNWRCNPSWCLSIGSGCACCALSIKEVFKNWFVSKWELEYMESPVIACVETSPEDRICQVVSAGTMLQLGPISVQFSDPSAVSTKLPKEVAIFHKMPDRDVFDLSKKLAMANGKTLCDIQSCTHGPVGDIQFYNISSLFDMDHINLNQLAGSKGLNKTNSWMSWSGVSSYYTCHPGHWPDCHSTGVVDHNGVAFENLKRSGDPATNYFFHSEQLLLADNPTLNLKGRPSYGAGQITALLEVQGLSLKSIHVKPSGLHMDINTCKGCYGCSTGFTCIIRIKLDKPDSFAVHLVSEDPDVVAPSISIILQSDTTEAREMRFFSATKKTEICLRLKEEDELQGIIKACSKAELEYQQAVLLENRRTLHTTSDANCTTGYFSCVSSNFSSFFGSVGQFFMRFFGSWWSGILIVLVIMAVVLLLIFFGPRIFTYFIVCFRSRRGYQKLVQFESLRGDWEKARQSVEAEKKRNVEVGRYLERLSKVQ